MKIAEILSVGTELLMGQIVDSNAAYLGGKLPGLGIACYQRQTVGDNLKRVTEAILLALSRSDLVITIGGLGPTQDDLTRDGIAEALGVPLVHDPRLESDLRDLFAKRGIRWTESQIRQAHYPRGAKVLENPNGTASGLWIEVPNSDKVILTLPGPPGELIPMFESIRDDLIETFGTGQLLVSKILKVTGIGESAVEEALGDLVDQANPTVAPYAKLGEVHLRVTAKAANEADGLKLVEATEDTIRNILGPCVYGTDEETLEESILALLIERDETVASAESITGGMLGVRLTDAPGSSQAYPGGVVTYSPDAKVDLIGVPQSLIDEFTPVSAEVAKAMAECVRAKVGSTWGVATTGNAGPTSDVGGKPVGQVYVAVSGPNGTVVAEHLFKSRRHDVRVRAGQSALVLLRNCILASRPD